MEKILDLQVSEQVRQAFNEMQQPVEILYFGSETGCETCEAARQLLEEVAALDDRIGLSLHESDDPARAKFGIDKSPTIVIAARDGDQITDLGIRFGGIPSGHEFSTLISDIVLVSRRDSGLSQKTRDFLKGLTSPLLLQVFVTPT